MKDFRGKQFAISFLSLFYLAGCVVANPVPVELISDQSVSTDADPGTDDWGPNDQCPEDPDKTEPGACGCGEEEGYCPGDAYIIVGKTTFLAEEPIAVNYYNLPGNPSDWVGIYEAGADNGFHLQFYFTDGVKSGAMNFEPLPVGDYSARLFFADTYITQQEVSFSVEIDDETDACPDDPGKNNPGICGCGVDDVDDDGDGTADCIDNCPEDSNKTQEGTCGCGNTDDDSDGDGTADCIDDCPQDSNKTEAGICGCGKLDEDADGDGVLDCQDKCPDDAGKTEPKICGCGRDEGSCGLTGTYFEKLTLTEEAFVRIDPTVDFNWGTGAPDESMNKETFSVRWTGSVRADFSETYTFHTLSDDGIRLWVDGTPIVNLWTPHGPTWVAGTLSLQSGQNYPIKIEYFESGGDAQIKLEWSSASQAREVVPADHLYPTEE